MGNTAEKRAFFARLVTSNAGLSPEGAVAKAFAAVSRERFLPRGPWKMFTASGYLETPSDDPAYVYQDVTISLKPESRINNGQPTLHALSLAALELKPGETVIHAGAGAGYYTAILAELVRPGGRVIAYEIDPELAERARGNLETTEEAAVFAQSATEGALPECDALYVNAGATGPLPSWLDALRPGGRLLFPLTPDQGAGAMLLVRRIGESQYSARFLCQALFIPMAGGRDAESATRLAAAFERGKIQQVRSLRRAGEPDATCWVQGHGWWLSTADPA